MQNGRSSPVGGRLFDVGSTTGIEIVAEIVIARGAPHIRDLGRLVCVSTRTRLATAELTDGWHATLMELRDSELSTGLAKTAFVLSHARAF